VVWFGGLSSCVGGRGGALIYLYLPCPCPGSAGGGEGRREQFRYGTTENALREKVKMILVKNKT